MVDEDNTKSRIGFFKLGTEYVSATRSKQNNNKYTYPADNLARFMEVDVSNLDAIKKYCIEYKLPIFLKIKQNVDYFIKEQKSIKRIFKRIELGNISIKEIELINKKLAYIHPKILYEGRKVEDFIDKKKMISVNAIRSSVIYKNIYSLLWQDLANYLISCSKIRRCLYCATIFAISDNPQKIYCTDECKYNYNNKKQYNKKKSAK